MTGGQVFWEGGIKPLNPQAYNSRKKDRCAGNRLWLIVLKQGGEELN